MAMTETLKASLARLPVTLATSRRRQSTLAGFVKRTNFDHSRTLSDITGASVWLKFENLQFTATFKERGALNRLSALSAEQRRRGVIAASAGNHAQGVAYHAARLSIPATIFVPVGTPTVKIENTRRHGATVIEGGATLEEAAALATTHGAREGLDLHSSLRRSADHRRPGHHRARDAGCGARSRRSDRADRRRRAHFRHGGRRQDAEARISRSSACRPRSIRRCTIVIKAQSLPMRGDTLAEGIAVKAPGRITSEIVRALVDDIVLVTEQDVEQALSLLLTIEKSVTEGAGAAGLAAVLADPERFKGRKLGLVLSGGNIDTRLLSGVLTRQLAREGRLSQLRFDIVDRPGQLGDGRRGAEQGRRQHRRGIASAHLHGSAGQGGASRSRDRDPGPGAS